jgi:hypothetical protein
LLFTSMLIEYSYIEAWSCFQFTHSSKSISQDFFSLDVPTGIVTLFKINEVGTIKEACLTAYAWSRFTRSGVEIRPRAHFDVELNTQASLGTVFGLIEDLGQLLTMLIGKASYVKKLGLCDESDIPVRVFFSSTMRRPEEELQSPEMCFPFADIKDLASALTENWLVSLPVLGPVYDLLFGTLFGQDSFVQSKFLSLTQALESFHRRTVGGTYVDLDKFATIRQLLENALPKSICAPLRRKLQDVIEYANEYSLRKRLKDLFGTLTSRTIQMLKIADVAATLNLIVDARNYLTHLDEDSKISLNKDIVAMHSMNERLTALLFILILKRLGMDEDRAATGIIKRRYFK